MRTDYLKNIAIPIKDSSFKELTSTFNPDVRDYGTGAYLFYEPYPNGGFVVSVYPAFRHLVSEEDFNGVLTTVAFLENEFYRLTKESEESEPIIKNKLLMERVKIQTELVLHGFLNFGQSEKLSTYNPEEQYCWGV